MVVAISIEASAVPHQFGANSCRHTHARRHTQALTYLDCAELRVEAEGYQHRKEKYCPESRPWDLKHCLGVSARGERTLVKAGAVMA